MNDVMSESVSIAKSTSVSEIHDQMLAKGTSPIVVTSDWMVVDTASRRNIAEKMGRKKRRHSNFAKNRTWVRQSRRSRDTRLLLCGAENIG
jgi:predicted transcriptional regulator